MLSPIYIFFIKIIVKLRETQVSLKIPSCRETNYVNQVVKIISKVVTKILYCLREGGAGVRAPEGLNLGRFLWASPKSPEETVGFPAGMGS